MPSSERRGGPMRTHALRALFALAILVASLAGTAVSAGAATGTTPYVGFHKQTTQADFAGSALDGVVVQDANGSADIRLDLSASLRTGKDKKLYSKKAFWYGTLESPVVAATNAPFDTAIASWNADTPAGTWLQVELRAYRPDTDHWTKYYIMGIWAAGTDTIERHSVNGQGDTDGFVATDTLLLYGHPAYTQYQYRLTLFTTDLHATPRVHLLSVMTSNSEAEAAGLDLAPNRSVWGTDLPVPQRSQMIYKKGGEVWCSPTSTSMVMAYWGISVPVPAAADGTYDYVYKGTGNWPFNTAYAASFGLEAYVTRLSSMAQVEQWIAAGVPVVISYAFGEGELAGTPIPSSDGHLMVIRGFDENGNVIANDPAAASDDAVRIVYDREDLERLWLLHSGGTVYLIYPKGWPVPSTPYGNW
ncbi:MAG: peptidase C39 family protein [Thermomicrobiaceae bacterium]|nr:peptidase C39 family protein [Thermomicrobiaceae bacterium]